MKKSLFARAGLIPILLVTTLLGVSMASTAYAAPRDDIQYDALGDSFASGYGVLPYANACGQSQAAYAVQLEGRMKIDLDNFVACAGAKTPDIATQLWALDENTDLVTISVGGNDILWSQAIGTCLVAPDTACMAAVGISRNLITNVLPGLLNSVYAEISTKAPDAHVIVTGYPRLFSPEYGDFSSGSFLATVAEQEALNEGADLLNWVIAGAAAEHGFQLVHVTKRFLGHGVNAPEPWVLGPLVESGAFHPNVAGYRAYTAAVTAAIVPARLR